MTEEFTVPFRKEDSTELVARSTKEIAYSSPSMSRRTALISGIRFLKLACPEGLHKGGEPVLYYLVKKTRERSRLYHSVDKGLIAGAWAAIAIRESGVI